MEGLDCRRLEIIGLGEKGRRRIFFFNPDPYGKKGKIQTDRNGETPESALFREKEVALDTLKRVKEK